MLFVIIRADDISKEHKRNHINDNDIKEALREIGFDHLLEMISQRNHLFKIDWQLANKKENTSKKLKRRKDELDQIVPENPIEIGEEL